LIAPIHTPQRYERIAERLAAEIRAGAFAPRERLPAERELARRLGVGRASVREAIAALQLQGIVETRPGSGTFVADVPPRAALPHDASPSDLLEARELIEPAIARLAAQRGHRDPAAEALLDAMQAASDSTDPEARAGWNESDRLFHRQIAAMTGNAVLSGLADQVAGLMDQPLWQRLRDDSIATAGRTAIHLAEHRMIYEAIAERDPEAAGLYAAQHVKRVRRYMTLD
jgi:DNA-binding FadR family transcriptional regulator